MKTTVIVPCAGKSTRYQSDLPKWMNTHPNGNLMLTECLVGLELQEASNIVVAVVKQHLNESGIKLNKVAQTIEDVCHLKPHFEVLDEFTTSQADTVSQVISRLHIEGPIFVKDCDNQFQVQVQPNNSICASILGAKTNPVNKSYISTDKHGFLAGIVEKQVIGNEFCVGGYSFLEAQSFQQHFQQLHSLTTLKPDELYISHVIQHMLLNGYLFDINYVTNYEDWGTHQDWLAYTKQFKTLFVDIDGVLVHNSAEYFEPSWGNSEALVDNIEAINSLHQTGKVMVVLTTARREQYREQTVQQLARFGLRYDRLIMGLLHTQRVLINDYATFNPYPSAVAFSIQRNSNTLQDLLGSIT